MDMIDGIDWRAEQDRFMALAFKRTTAAAHDSFRKWHRRKRDDAVAEMIGKMWDQWSRLVVRGKNPEPMIRTLLKWAILWVRYDRKIGGRGQSPDVYDYRAGMTRHDMDFQGRPHPTERSDPINGWLDWAVDAGADDPAELAAALDAFGLTSEDLAA
ncbi:MAG: hypothetical protein JWN86_1376 [Planctomycetota bacterium]|nr:hypothetical protein [Planctomycetota bacterium]